MTASEARIENVTLPVTYKVSGLAIGSTEGPVMRLIFRFLSRSRQRT